MKFEGIIEGKYVTLRSVEVRDAQSTLNMRLDPKNSSMFFHKVENNVEKQEAWIKKQQEKEGDWFFIAEDKKENPVGTVGMIDVVGDSGFSSRLIGVGNAFQSFEIQMLILDWGFEYLKLKQIRGDVDENNDSALKFAKYFGWKFEEPCFDEERGRRVIFLSLTKDLYKVAREKMAKMIYREK